ncbi:MAG TPA: universal stress protein [Steroidobacteraceae bacterium]|nr:universal stress protein [Steroidobacteraceae bacterium]
MPTIRRILLAVKNPRQRAFPALAKAAALAQALGAQLELFHAISGPVAVDAFSEDAIRKYEDGQRALHLRRLEAMATPLRQRGLAVTTAAEWDYPSYEAVIRHARRSRADLIVVGRHEGRHVARWLLRYSDWELLRQSPVPVLLVKKARPYRSPAILAAVDPSHAFAKTAQLDGAILEAGSAISGATGGALHVLHAYVPTIDDISQGQLRQPNASQLIVDHAAKQAERRLEKTLRGAKVEVKAARRHVLAMHPVDAIPQLARRLGCDIVVMGALARSGLKGLFIGNTAERLFDDLNCDLLVVKPPGFKSQVAPGIRGPELYFPLPPSAMV